MSKFSSKIISGRERGILSRLLDREEPEAIGAIIDGYTLEEKLGEGGFGIVWRAKQEHPVRRQVALKILKRGMDTAQVLARFDLERQALAGMRHPAIAALLDAGETGDGRPYFAMELVQGRSITEYCQQHRLPWQERVQLFLEVCRGVQHAHQQGIIHRDLKPNNILVALTDARPMPKIIDFGIAKALMQGGQGYTLVTRPGHVLGTPQYMSPEQLRGDGPLDIRSDVYALGAQFYEMLTGELPYQEATGGRQTTPAEMLHLVNRSRPRRPSTRVIAASRASKISLPIPGSHGLPADLDWIILKCLEQDKERRYDSVGALIADLLRFRQNEPVHARPPSFSYLAGRWIRRNRLILFAAVISLAGILGGAAAALWQARVAIQARHLAELESARAKGAAGFLTSLLDRVASGVGLGHNPEALKLALDDSPRLIAELGQDPVLQAELYQKVGRLYESMGERKLALPLIESHAQMQARMHGSHSQEALAARLSLASLITDHGDRRRAPPLLSEILQSLEAAGQRGSLLWYEARRLLIRAWEKMNYPAKARQEALSALEEAERSPGIGAASLFALKLSACQAFILCKDFPQAEQMIRHAEDLLPRIGGNPLAIANLENRRLSLWKAQGKHDQIVSHLRKRLEDTPQPQAQSRYATLLLLAEAETRAGRHADAISHAAEAVALATAQAPDPASLDQEAIHTQRRDLVEALRCLAARHSAAGAHPQAIQSARRAVAISQEQGHGSMIAKAMQTLAEVYQRSGDLEAAYHCHLEREQRINTHLANYNRWYEDLQARCSIRLRQKRPAEALALALELWQKVSAIPEAQDDAEHLGDTASLVLQCHKAVTQADTTAPVSEELLTQLRSTVEKGDLARRARPSLTSAYLAKVTEIASTPWRVFNGDSAWRASTSPTSLFATPAGSSACAWSSSRYLSGARLACWGPAARAKPPSCASWPAC
ncbi:MAG: serine/threonine protein kinase [Prosthecobacter sp.]|nr:serine/threonine protein kinase [Prosthecobacter sp.]